MTLLNKLSLTIILAFLISKISISQDIKQKYPNMCAGSDSKKFSEFKRQTKTTIKSGADKIISFYEDESYYQREFYIKIWSKGDSNFLYSINKTLQLDSALNSFTKPKNLDSLISFLNLISKAPVNTSVVLSHDHFIYFEIYQKKRYSFYKFCLSKFLLFEKVNKIDKLKRFYDYIESLRAN